MKKIIFLFAAICFIIGCKKNSSSSPSNTNPATTLNPNSINSIPLKIGNYWIYENYKEDTLGNQTLLGKDSLYIYDTVTIAGRKYFKSSPGLFGTNVIYPRQH